MNKFRPFFAVFLLLALLCGCAAPHEVTTVSLPDAQPTTTLDSASTAAPVESTGGEFHYEYQTLPLPAPLLSATALTVLGDVILVGGFTEDGLALARMPLDGEAEALPLPDGAEYLYALGSDNEDGFWLLSGSLPGAYADGHGAVHFSESTTIGKLALTHYDSAGTIQETILLQTIYAENGARFSQLRTTEHGFLLLSSSLLVLLDKAGAEIARQTAETDDGWAYEAMALSGGTLCVLTRDRYGATPLPELRRFAPETLAPTDTLPCETNLTGLGLAADGRLLCGSSKSIDAETAELTAAEVLVSWQEQGLKNTACQLFQSEFGFLLYSPDDTELAILRRVPGPAPEKTVLTLAIAAGDAMMPQFTTMIEDFNRNQDKFRVDYEIYSDSNYTDYAPADQLRTQITAGQAPDLYAFYMAGYNAPPFAAEDVGADLLPLLGSEFTADSLLPNLYDLLTEDGKLYQLPLTVEVDTLIARRACFQSLASRSRIWRQQSGRCRRAGFRSTHGTRRATSSRSARPTASGRMWTKQLRHAILRRRASAISSPGAARGAATARRPPSGSARSSRSRGRTPSASWPGAARAPRNTGSARRITRTSAIRRRTARLEAAIASSRPSASAHSAAIWTGRRRF